MRRLRIPGAGCVALLLALIMVPVVAQEPTTLTILDVVYEDQFPDVEVQLRYLDQQQQPIPNVTSFEVSIGNQLVSNPVAVTTERGPMAVAIVADLSTHMRDKGMPHKRNRFVDMQSLLQEQMLALQLPRLRASLVTFTDEANLYYPMSTDLGGLRNIINGSVPEYPFAPQEEAADGAAYPLEEAIITALEQLGQEAPDVPRALFVFAAGDPDTALDLERIEQAFSSSRSGTSAVHVMAVAFGSDQEGTFTTRAANPGILEQLAAVTGGRYVHYFAADVDQAIQLQTEVKTQFAQILQVADYYSLRFQADPTLVGMQDVRVRVGSTADTYTINIAAVPPRVSVVVNSRDFQGKVRMTVRTDFAQSELAHVEYLLNNHRIGQSEKAPDFVYEIDSYARGFQELFPPGNYELVAAVRDVQGLESRSEPLVVEVFAPPVPDSPLAWVMAFITGIGGIILLALVVVLAVVVGVMYGMQRRQKIPRISKQFPTNRQPTRSRSVKVSETVLGDDELTSEVDNDLTAEFNPEELTQVYNPDDLTARYDPTAVRERIFRVLVERGIDPEARKEFHLRSNGSMHYFIGRPSTNNTKQPDIVLPNNLVSREHARLVMLADGGVELVAGHNTNGTFFGEEKIEMAPDEKRVLQSGDVFWISPVVKLRLEEEL